MSNFLNKWLPINCLSKYDCCSVLSVCSYSLFPLWMLSGPPQQKVAAAVSIPPDSKVSCFSVLAMSPASAPSSSSSSGFAAGVAVGSCETEDLGARTVSNADWWVFLCSFLLFAGLQLLHLGGKKGLKKKVMINVSVWREGKKQSRFGILKCSLGVLYIISVCVRNVKKN